MNPSLLTPERIHRMVTHWLNTPVNGYDGSDYGNDLASVLMSPFSAGLADAQIAKLKRDVPILATLPAGAIAIYAQQVPPDELFVTLRVGALTFDYRGNA